MEPDASPDEPRHVGPLLATAIVGMPVIFAWLLLRRGYAGSTRRAGFLFMGATLAVGVIPMVFGG